MPAGKDWWSEDIESLALNPRIATEATCRPTATTRVEKTKWKRLGQQEYPGSMKKDVWDLVKPVLTERGALFEANRCLKCLDAPCQKSCPTGIDIKTFIGMMANRNYYGAAKQILSDNPLGLSCGMICPTSDLCMGGCNLQAVEEGPIDIGALQAFAVDTFARMNIPATPDPAIIPDGDYSKMPPAYKRPVALIGAGPASISCATFLARLGYSNLHIYERRAYPGGLSAHEIPEYRLQSAAVQWEVRLLQQLGVKIHYNRTLGADGQTVQSYHDGTVPAPTDDGAAPTSGKDEKAAAVFIGIGLPDPRVPKCFGDMGPAQGVYTSKSFLPPAAEASKRGLCCKVTGAELPKVYGRVAVLGAGDTAFDCATSAFRCGAERVIVVFRRSTADMRAVEEEIEVARREDCEFLPYCQPVNVIKGADGRVAGLDMVKMEKQKDGSYRPDEDQKLRIKVDFVISAFGSCVDDEKVAAAIAPATVGGDGRLANVDQTTMNVGGIPWLFAGGDCAGGQLTVEASNDGKIAAWGLHRYMQTSAGAEDPGETPKLPLMHTAVDDVDVSIDMCGMHFLNPFGLASAPPATTGPMIERAFEQGWGWAVTKTFVLDKDFVTNVSPRIVRGTTSGHRFGPGQGAFLNIELISEKSAAYWISAVKRLKKRYPKHIVFASVMCGYNKKDWQELVTMTLPSGADALELNLSCPHGMGEKGMGLACGQRAEMVEDICSWVKEVCPIPFFAKMTPNITDITTIASAAMRGGATGVTAINTVSGMMDLQPTPTGEPWPAVGYGLTKMTTYGGMSGGATRPLALRAISAIAKRFPGIPITATGGVDSGDTALAFLQVGASVMQVSSAIQNQDFTLINDFITGLRARLYMNGRSDLRQWLGQAPPLAARVGHGHLPRPANTPRFGEYETKRREMRLNAPVGIVDDLPDASTPVPEIDRVPKLKDVIGVALKHIGTFGSLAPKEQVVALVDDDLCINCGKCVMTCNDTGYQAIHFDQETHIPTVGDDCTGCTLCLSVCPVPRCIQMVPRAEYVPPKRGIPFGEPVKIDV